MSSSHIHSTMHSQNKTPIRNGVDSKKASRFLIIMLAAVLFLASCENSKPRIDGAGDYTTKVYSINDVYEIRVSTYAEVYITKEETALRIEAQSNILQVLHVSDNAGILEIGKDNEFGHMKPLKIYVSTKQLSALQTAGKINVSSSDSFTSPSFKIDMSGTGNVNLMVETNQLSTYLSGEIEMDIRGKATIHHLFISGQADISGFELLTEETAIDVSGMSEIEVQVEDKLDIDISGKATIYYKGNPEIHQDISGSGSIIAVN